MTAGVMIPSYSNSGALPSSVVELSLRAEGLQDLDLLSKSDPFCVVYLKDGSKGAEWTEVGRTEHIWDTLSPVWQKKIILEYRFEERQHLRFCIYDLDSTSSSELDSQDFLGSTECTLGEVVSKQSNVNGLLKTLDNGHGAKISIIAEELSSNKEEAVLKFSARKLDKMDWFGKSDPFLEIHKSTESGQYILTHRTEQIKHTLDPQWKEFKISVTSLCNGDYDRDLRFDVYDWNRSGSHQLIGSFHTTLKKLKTGPSSENVYDVINKEKQRKKGQKYKNSGNVHLNAISVKTIPSFLEYIRGGTQVNFTLAVDFTGSNGNPTHPSSLHYKDPTGRPNQYVTAIQAVGEIIQDYDSDKMFPALGFGARIPPSGQVSHEFFMNLCTDNPHCQGIEGVLEAYYNSLQHVQLYGPTNFSPVIRHVARFAEAYQSDPSNYFVLLIITDGIITDLDETKRSIIDASRLPLSIIIIGVGEEDFAAMDDLDSDDNLLRIGNHVAERDIVQFVEMRKFLVGNTGQWSKQLLAKEVLAEIPAQLLSFMTSKGFKPPEPAPSDSWAQNNQFQPGGAPFGQSGLITVQSAASAPPPGSHSSAPPPPY